MKERLGMIVRAKERYVITHLVPPLLFLSRFSYRVAYNLSGIDYDIARWSM